MEDNREPPDFDATKAELFEAISHPVRIRILQVLNDKPMAFAELARAVGVGSGGHLSFHLTKLRHLIKMTQSGTYALTGDGREALWSVNSLKRASGETTPEVRIALFSHRSLWKPILVLVLIGMILLAGVAVYQQGQATVQAEQNGLLRQQMTALLQQIGLLNHSLAGYAAKYVNFDPSDPNVARACSRINGAWDTGRRCTLNGNATIGVGQLVTIDHFTWLIVPKGFLLTNFGIIDNNFILLVEYGGTISNFGTINNFYQIVNNGTINNAGVIRAVNNYSTFANYGTVTNDCGGLMNINEVSKNPLLNTCILPKSPP